MFSGPPACLRQEILEGTDRPNIEDYPRGLLWLNFLKLFRFYGTFPLLCMKFEICTALFKIITSIYCLYFLRSGSSKGVSNRAIFAYKNGRFASRFLLLDIGFLEASKKAKFVFQKSLSETPSKPHRSVLHS